MNLIALFEAINWQPHFGDPTLFGWATTLAYLLAVALSGLCALNASRLFSGERVRIHQALWGGLALSLLLLGINKQLDLQSPITDLGRSLAYQQGWYEARQEVQNVLVFGMGFGALVVLAGVFWVVRSHWRRYWAMLFGLIFLARFIFVRAASFYGVALLPLSQFTGGLRINWLLEITGVSILGLSAVSNLLTIPPNSGPADQNSAATRSNHSKDQFR